VEVDDSLLEEDKTMIEDLLAAACNDAVHKVERAQQDKMSGLASGFGLPLGKMPF
jgi:DNA-binding protein YbaB